MIDAAAFRRMLASGSAWVASHAAALDAINVFPVPDGDTSPQARGSARTSYCSGSAKLSCSADTSART